MTIETSNAKSVAHYGYPAGEHDSIQYHFFADGLVFSARVFRTESLERHFFWLYDGKIKEIVNSSEKICQQPVEYLDIKSTSLAIVADATGGSLFVNANGEQLVHITFNVKSSFTYLPTLQDEPVTHLPNLECTILYQNRKIEGTGYCKRYFGKYPSFWNYRFIHSVMPLFTVWSADALFGNNKYHYFHLQTESEGTISSLNRDSSVSDDTAQGVIAKQACKVFFEPIASWQARLHSDAMDSLLQQHYCIATLTYQNQTITGLCLNEVCAGTLA